MQLKAQPENSLSSKLEYLKQLVNAKTTKEIITVLNGGTNVKVNKLSTLPHLADIQTRLGVDIDEAYEVYEANSN